jgi:hypothetical protein
MADYSYPSTFPLAEASLLLPAVEGKTYITPVVIHAGWVMEGFILGQVLPLLSAQMAAGCLPGSEEHRRAATHLERAVLSQGSAEGIDWKSLLPLILSLLQQLLGGK